MDHQTSTPHDVNKESKASAVRKEKPDHGTVAGREAPGGNAEALQSIADNSSAMLQMKAWQEMADRSPQVQEVAQLQEMASNPAVIQRVKLQPGRLNIVGENHTESNARREDEIRLAGQEVKGGYWNENEFRARDKREDETFTEGGEDDPRAYADPLSLQIGESVMWVQDGIKAFISMWTHLVKLEKNNEKLAEVKEELKNPLLKIKSYLNEIHRLIPLLEGNEERHTTAEEHAIIAIKALYLRPRDTFLALLDEWRPFPLRKIAGDGFFVKFMKIVPMVNRMGPPAADLAGKDLEESRLRRSGAMLAAAVNRKDAVGVWKIGFNHVTDFKKKLAGGESGHFNLVEREEFNHEYQELPVLEDGKMVKRKEAVKEKVDPRDESESYFN